jgi:putative ABC transport system permease protein
VSALTLLSAFFGALATALAGIGLYGLLSYSVTRRTREIGIRMALGAGRGQVVGLVLREISLLAGLGIVIAAPLSFPLSALTKSMLLGVAPGDGWAVAAAAGVLAFTALLAATVPAMKAIGVDPLSALRND